MVTDGPAEVLHDRRSEREVLEHLENSIDHCQRVGSTLANLAIKHG